jgi:hypothetical protein
MAPYRILSLDGGGSWALIQVRTLVDLYAHGTDGSGVTGHDILKRFDYVAANSGGTLTLAGLIRNWPLSRLLDLFLEQRQRQKIFAHANVFDHLIDHAFRGIGIGPKYGTRAKYKGLVEVLEADAHTLLTDLPARIGPNYAGRQVQFLFCAYNYDTERATFLRSDAGSLAGSRAPNLPTTLAEAVHASANPPVNYFDEPARCNNNAKSYWDGAVGGYNNPVLAAVIEVLANAERVGAKRGEIKALSIGTGNNVLPLRPANATDDPALYAPSARRWLLNDVKKIAQSMLDDPPDAATFHAHVMLDGALPKAGDPLPAPSPIMRLNPLVQPLRSGTQWMFPPGYDAQSFTALRDLDSDAVKDEEVTIIRTFCERWLSGKTANQPIRANSGTFDAEIGFNRYPPARVEALRHFPL